MSCVKTLTYRIYNCFSGKSITQFNDLFEYKIICINQFPNKQFFELEKNTLT